MIDLQSLLKPVFGDLPHTHDAAGVVGEHVDARAPGPQVLGQGADLADVGHRDGLPAGHVHCGRDADIRDAARADFLDKTLKGL